MAHRLDIRVVANGVDTEALFRFALVTDCDLVQGPQCGRVMTADEFGAWLERQARGAGRGAAACAEGAATLSATDAS
jgi:EAL domain-containing protein (putative c-di-GMP-specific phosphodiesterase class I)